MLLTHAITIDPLLPLGPYIEWPNAYLLEKIIYVNLLSITFLECVHHK